MVLAELILLTKMEEKGDDGCATVALILYTLKRLAAWCYFRKPEQRKLLIQTWLLMGYINSSH